MKALLTRTIAAAALGSGLLGWSPLVAADDKKDDHAMTGVLIDNMCGAKQKDEAAAKKHPVKCSLKEDCAASGYQLVVGEKHHKLTAKGNEKAKAYLEKADSNHVTIEGKMEGEMMDVTSIKKAEDHGGHHDAK